jgi:hypothetical protein
VPGLPALGYKAATNVVPGCGQQGSLERVVVKRWLTSSWPLPAAAAVFVLGVLIWQATTLRAPIAGEHNWRQSDTYSVAYNFVHENAPFIYPRVDWSKGRSGIMGMETPVYTYCSALLMRVFGDSPFSGRLVSWLSLLMGLAAVFVAFRPVPLDWPSFAPHARENARRDSTHDLRPNPLWLPIGMLTFAVLSPLFFFEGRQFQPDPMMGGMTMAAAGCFHAYAKRERAWIYALGMLLYCAAVGAKSPAIIAGPALWLLCFTASPRLRWYTPIVCGLPFVLPVALFWGWERWADHLTRTFNGGEEYFATHIKWNEYFERFRDKDAMRRAFRFVFPSYTSNWVLFPVLLAGFLLSFRRGLRAITFPMLLWLLIGLFFCAGSERLTWHWYYTFMMMLPVVYFGGVGIAALFEGTYAYAETSRVVRWGVWSMGLALLLTRWAGGPPQHLIEVVGSTYPAPTTWTYEKPFLCLIGIQLISIPLALFVRFRGARWLATALVVVAMVLAFPRATRDVRQVFLWRSRVDLWRDMRKHWLPMRRVLDEVSTRKDVFVVDGDNPWYLHLALRKGYVKGVEASPEELLQYQQRKVRFYLHFKEASPLLQTLVRGPLLRAGPRWELYCIDPNGCATKLN